MINLQKVVDFLSAQKGVPRILVKCVAPHEMRNVNAVGECVWQKGFIRVNFAEANSELELLMAVFHEWRHWWQYCRYTEHFLWWMINNKDWYYEVYNTSLCTIEEDARLFGCSLGSRNASLPLQKSLDHLAQVRQEGVSSQELAALEMESYRLELLAEVQGKTLLPQFEALFSC